MISVKPFAALQMDILHIILDETFPFYGTCDVPAGKKKYSCQKKEPDALF
jgi:hypothetical protein